MNITKIEAQKKRKGRSNVFIDGEFAFGIADFDLLRLHLKEGMVLSDGALLSIKQEVLLQETKQYALKLLDRHSYTEAAMRRKLAEQGSAEDLICEVVEFLKSYRYIDDESYARRYMEAALCAGKSGMKKIQYDLCAKGIDRALVQQVAAEFENETTASDELDNVRRLLNKKLKGDVSFPNKMKAKRYLLSRGFSIEVIDRVLSEYAQEENEEWYDV